MHEMWRKLAVDSKEAEMKLLADRPASRKVRVPARLSRRAWILLAIVVLVVVAAIVALNVS